MEPADKNIREIFFSKQAGKMPLDGHRIKFILRLMKEKNFLPTIWAFKPPPKNMEESLRARKKGNELFGKRDYMAALEAYNEALCFAPIGSESMGCVYANRSAIYLDAGFYAFSLENIQLALDHNYPDHLKQKLIQRKETCMEKMKTEKDSFDIYGNLNIPKLSYPANPKIPFMIDALKCVKDEKFGRHIVTTRYLHPGDIVLIEEPFVHNVNSVGKFGHCYNCGVNNFFNLKPCPKSINVMFCSTKCADEAWDRFYKYEVQVINELFRFDSPISGIRATLKAFTMVKDVDELKDLIALIDVEKENAFNLDWTRASEKDKFRVLYSLATNENERSVEYMHHLQMNMAIIYNFLRLQTEFKRLIASEEHEIFFLNLWQRLCLTSNLNVHQLTGRFVLDQAQGQLRALEHGQGIHLLFSMVNHSCCPNVYRIQVEQNTVVVVIRPIKAGGQLFDSYGALYSNHSLEERKEKLQVYHFDCKCEACLNNFSIQRNEKDVPRTNFIPSEIYEQINIFEDLRFDREMLDVVKKLIKSLPKVITKGQKYYPCQQVSILEEKLVYGKMVLQHKLPLNLILASKNNL